MFAVYSGETTSGKYFLRTITVFFPDSVGVKTPLSEEIQIGMLSASMQRYFPATANVWNLEYATSKAFFYNGCSESERNALKITDRPVYRIRPSDKRTILGYDILNATKENGLRIFLEDVVDGAYTIDGDTQYTHRLTR